MHLHLRESSGFLFAVVLVKHSSFMAVLTVVSSPATVFERQPNIMMLTPSYFTISVLGITQ